MPEDCLFCKIVAGDVPSYTVYEDEAVRAFLDVNPVSTGHTLVVPRQHAETLQELDEDVVAPLFEAVQTVMQQLDAALEPAGINIVQNNGTGAGQEIPHVHVHVIPREPGDRLAIRFQGEELDEDVAETLLDRLQ